MKISNIKSLAFFIVVLAASGSAWAMEKEPTHTLPRFPDPRVFERRVRQAKTKEQDLISHIKPVIIEQDYDNDALKKLELVTYTSPQEVLFIRSSIAPDQWSEGEIQQRKHAAVEELINK